MQGVVRAERGVVAPLSRKENRPSLMLPADARILIIKPSALGDVATSLPMLCDLHEALPGARIDWLIQPGYAALLEGHDAISALVPFDRQKLAAWWYKPSVNRAFRSLVATLRGRHYDCVIDAQGLLRSGFFARITGAPGRIGFASAREGATLAYTDKVLLPDEGRKMLAVDRMRALLAPLGIRSARPAQFRVPVNAAAERHMEEILGATHPAVVIPGARWDTKRWSREGFVEIVDRLQAAGVPVVLGGSPDERPLCESVAAACQAAPLNLAGQTSLAEMTAVLARSRIVVCNDSGPLHVAVALGKQVVALYGPTDPAYVGPYGQLDRVVRFDVPCFPCRRRTCDHHSCMRGVTTEAVWDKVQEVLHAEAPVAGS